MSGLYMNGSSNLSPEYFTICVVVNLFQLYNAYILMIGGDTNGFLTKILCAGFWDCLFYRSANLLFFWQKER